MKNALVAVLIVAVLALGGCVGTSSTSSGAALSPQPTTTASSSSAAQTAQTSAETSSQGEPTATASAIIMRANGTALQVTLADTEAASALAELLSEGPIAVSLHPYGGFEKVGSLPQALPTSDRPVTTSPGDVMLYQGNQITVFHGVNSWDYTPLGHIEGATAESLLDALGEGDITIELSL